jgi:glutaredoxin
MIRVSTKIEFYEADYCVACHSVKPLLKDIKYDDINLSSGNIAEDKAIKNNVSTLPTIIFYRDGVESYRHIGVFGKGDLKKMIERAGT